jgi:hypothetical protein
MTALIHEIQHKKATAPITGSGRVSGWDHAYASATK